MMFFGLSLSINTKTNFRRRCLSIGIGAVFSAMQIQPIHAAEDSLVEQLKVVRALQIEQQKEELMEARDEETRIEKTYERGRLIARGIIAIPSPGSELSEFPLGYSSVSQLDPALDNDNSALILTAVSKQGPPVAAKRFKNLKSIKFPFIFEITVDDLLFPYNADIWEKSPRSTASISVTCVLEPDGRLSTAEPQARFGFAISDPLPSKDKDATFQRTDAKIIVTMKSDGKPYNGDETSMLSRVDTELDRLELQSASNQ
jgi:hypothetical protein